MRRFIPLTIIMVLGLVITFGIIPGCDELVTKEIHYDTTIEEAHYDTTFYDTTIIYETDETCYLCHNDISDSISIATGQWAYSSHAEDSLTSYDYLNQNTATCGPECHTREGFVQSLESSSVDPVGFPTEIGCFACHAPHTNRDFSLRTNEAIIFTGGGTYDEGNSNICAKCHQAIAEPPSGDDTQEIVLTSNWGPHFSTQANMFIGIGGYEYDGFTFDNSGHTLNTTKGCIDCHQDQAKGFTLGGHNLTINDGSNQLVEGCNVSSCHSSDPIDDVSSFKTEQATLLYNLDSLKGQLIAVGLLDASDVPASITIEGPDSISDSAGAVFNYLFVKADGSGGVHNLDYALDLVNSALDFLTPE